MKKMLEELDKIQTSLAQIETITQNQMTVLKGEYGAREMLDLLEEMANYKEELTEAVHSHEEAFQLAYEDCKGAISQKQALRLQQEVSCVLELRERIVFKEEQNLKLMEKVIYKQMREMEPTPLPKPPGEVVKAYNQNKKTSSNLQNNL
jgi:hypothetical protein